MLILIVTCFWCIHGEAQDTIPVFRNSDFSIDQRINDLLTRLTTTEKISLLGFRSKAVPRLGIAAYNWWNEGLHGVARAGKATVFPQAIALAATFNDKLVREVADIISTEARAKFNLQAANGYNQQYMGLTFWSPNINILRDPRWGRGQETYGEDPYLTAAIGTAFVKGMQGNDNAYLKTAACAKHFAVHSGPEGQRHSFNAVVDEKDLRETYLYAFKKLVDAGVESVMCAYNLINNEPCCTNNTLLKKILREEWKFKGHIVTDCWALEDIWKRHKVMNNSVEVAAAAVKAGINLDCSNLLQDDIVNAYKQKMLTTEDIDSALIPLLRTSFHLGLYNNKNRNPYSSIGEESIHTQKAIDIAKKAAQQSIVLMKNDNAVLPLDKNKIHSLAVLGPNAASLDALLANYHGISPAMITYAEGISEAAGPAIAVQYEQAVDYSDTNHIGGVWMAGESDVTVVVIGLTPALEGEDGDAFLAPNNGDKISLNIPAAHIKLLQLLKKNGKPVIVVITGGGAVNIDQIEPYADAILFAWYAGEQGGTALADILFGNISPSGRLPVTFYHSLSDLPAYDNYSMAGRTYRYFNGKVKYPFGYGLSYTRFLYQWVQKPYIINAEKDSLFFSVIINNIGNMDADEVVQVYIGYPNIERMPVKELKSFERIFIKRGEAQTIRFGIPLSELQKWNDEAHRWELYKGQYDIMIGASSQDIRLDVPVKINID